MRTITKTLYQYDELPTDKAKERARDWFRSVDTEYNWAGEAKDSMEKFAKLFPIRVTNWSYGGRDSGVTFEFIGEDGLAEMTGRRLFAWLINHGIGKYTGGDCPLTGYCLDENLLDNIRAFMARPFPITFRELLNDCFSAWVTAVECDIEYQGSDEAVAEMLQANEYEFDEDGRPS